MRGASRGVLEVGQVRRPRACHASTHSGGPGSPSVPTTGDCFNWLDAARTKGGESCPDRGGRSPPVRARKLRPRGQKSPRWRAERRHASATVRDTLRMDAPLGAPSPRFMRGTEKGLRRTRRRKEYGRSRMSIRSARPRASGDPVLDARLRGHERRRGNRGAQRQNETGRALPIRGMAIARPDDVAPRVICWRTTTVHAHDHARHR
jgi:hypothetical protein